MGQTGSTIQDESGAASANIKRVQSKHYTNIEINEYFNKKAIQEFNPAELICFKAVINFDGVLDKVIPDDIIAEKLCLPRNNPTLNKLIVQFIKTLANFPFINCMNSNINGSGLLKAISLLTGRSKKFITSKSFNKVRLLFTALSTTQIDIDNNKCHNRDETYIINELLESYDNTDFSIAGIPAINLLQFITWLLVLKMKCTSGNCQINLNTTEFDNIWKRYEESAKNIIRSMNGSLFATPKADDNKTLIKYDEFSNVLTHIVPNLLNPLENIMEHFLYMDSDLVLEDEAMVDIDETKLMTKELFSLLSASLPTNLAISKLQKLYIGRESGFSMRSIQSKVFKWLAPTILLISGMRITNDEDYAKSKNPRYRKFLEQFHKLRDDDQHLDDCFMKKRKVTFAIYINDPWKVTNKTYFGGPSTTIVQLSPRQDIYKANDTDIVYFNTIGGGIAAGATQPIIKPGVHQYVPGNISLTIDSSLEFGVFRNVGHGGKINPGCLGTESNKTNDSFELRFIVQDVEIWGCGGAKELDEQIRQLKWEEAESKRRQHVNLKSLGEDRALLEMAGLVGQHQSGGSI